MDRNMIKDENSLPLLQSCQSAAPHGSADSPALRRSAMCTGALRDAAMYSDALRRSAMFVVTDRPKKPGSFRSRMLTARRASNLIAIFIVACLYSLINFHDSNSPSTPQSRDHHSAHH